jgi:LytS/YehU family sensor histidine kinase
MFRYPVLGWVSTWLVFFLLHLQFSPYWALLKATSVVGSLIIVFYSMQNFILPRFFEKKSWKFPVGTFLLVITFATILTELDLYFKSYFRDSSEDMASVYLIFIWEFLLTFLAMWISLSLFLFRKEQAHKQEVEELKSDKTESELKFLKAQINPHFLFNALNNIYTMAYIGDKGAPEKIARLSDMLRYVIYDCSIEFVPLEKELIYLNNYTEFQNLKTEKKQNINIEVNIENEAFNIAPMILIPFVENAFKHSCLGSDTNSFVNVKLDQKGDTLKFIVENSIPSIKAPSDPASSGIGIENLKNRLALIYKNKAVVETKITENVYYISLTINLSKDVR